MDGKGKAGEAKRAATPAIAAAAASRRASLIRVSLPPRGGAPYPLSDWGERVGRVKTMSTCRAREINISISLFLWSYGYLRVCVCVFFRKCWGNMGMCVKIFKNKLDYITFFQKKKQF